MINGTRYHPAIASQSWDAIVVGSGLGGLTCAALMAKAGKRVLVLERHYTAGGFTHSFRRRGFEWDVGVHYIGDVHKPHSPMRRVFDTITDGQLQWAKMDDVYDSMLIAGNRYDYHTGVNAFRDGLLQHFPNAGKDIDAYLQHVRRASQSVLGHFGPRLLPALLQGAATAALRRFSGDYFARTTFDVLSECTRDAKLASVLAGQWGDYGTPPKQSSFAMHALVAQHYLDGANFPVGGASQIAHHIIPVIEASGGAVLVNAEVEEVMLHQGRVSGVRMANGDTIDCAQVISAAGVHTTFSRLLPEAAAQASGLLEKVEKLPRSIAHLGLYVGLKGSRETLGLAQSNLWVYRDYDHDESLQRFLKAPGMDFPVKYLSFPSAKDPAWAKHFPDKSTIDVIAPAPWAWFQRWQDAPWKQRGAEYDDYKQQLSERLLDEIYTQVPQVRGKVEHVELSTPLSTAHFSNYASGELYGLEHSPYRFAQRWLTPRTPIKGLYLTGQDMLFCGVGSALMSGVLTASVLLGPKLLAVTPDLLAGRSTAMAARLKRWLGKALPTPQPISDRPAVTAPSPWFEARCVAVETLAVGSNAFRFTTDTTHMKHYRPGQFVTVEAEVDGRRICRSYTLSSTPSRPDSFEISIKRVADGPFSNWICDQLQVGHTLKISGPFGEFSCAPKPARKILLLSAGSGITPMLSMARWIADRAPDTDVVFLHIARSRAELMFGTELKSMARVQTNLKVRISLTQEPADSPWRGSRGRLDTRLLRRAVNDLPQRAVYLCGPEGFMAHAQELLREGGLPAHQLHLESFNIGGNLSGSGGEVRFATSEISLSASGSESLLDLAEAAGIAIPSACRSGHCGECKVRCVSGDVQMTISDGLSPEEIAEGYVLTCVAAANGDVALAA
jgi:all-trans-retinol 13,14-reductase